MRLFLLTIMNGLTLAALYFLVASGFTLVFGLMRNVNLAHGSLYLLGAYIGYDAADASGSVYCRRNWISSTTPISFRRSTRCNCLCCFPARGLSQVQ